MNVVLILIVSLQFLEIKLTSATTINFNKTESQCGRGDVQRKRFEIVSVENPNPHIVQMTIQFNTSDLIVPCGLFKKSTIISKIIHISYNHDIQNFDKVVKFIHDLGHSPEILAHGYTALFDEMTKNKHLDTPEIFSLAFHVRKAMKMNTTWMRNQGKSIFDALKKRFYPGVQAVIWNPSIRLQNRGHGRILHNFNASAVHTNLANMNQTTDDWEVRPADHAGHYFVFRGKEHMGYLDSSHTPLPKHKSDQVYPLRTHWERNGDFQAWKITPIEGGTYYWLQDRHYGRVLDGDMWGFIYTFPSYNGWPFQHWKII